MALARICIILAACILIAGCSDNSAVLPEPAVKEESALETCDYYGGECAEPGQTCGGIHFELAREVSDCPGSCCVCCKKVIPECAPDACCHARGCVLVQSAPDCKGVVCTQECIEGTLDCGQASCEFDNQARGYCRVVMG